MATAPAAPAASSAPPSRCLCVFNLHHDTTDSRVRDFFNVYGTLDKVDLIREHRSTRNKGFGFVYFKHLEDAQKAVNAALEKPFEIDGRTLRVDFSRTSRAYSPTPGQYMGKRSPSPVRRGRSRSPPPRRRSRSRSGSRARSRSPARHRSSSHRRHHHHHRRRSHSRSRSRSKSPNGKASRHRRRSPPASNGRPAHSRSRSPSRSSSRSPARSKTRSRSPPRRKF